MHHVGDSLTLNAPHRRRRDPWVWARRGPTSFPRTIARDIDANRLPTHAEVSISGPGR